VSFMMALLLLVSGDSLVGRDAFSRLDFGIGAREVAMGGAATACCNSPAAAFWNPAALSMLSAGAVSSFYQFTPLGSAFRHDRDVSGSLAWGQPAGYFAFGFVLDHLRLGGVEARRRETRYPDGFLDYSETMASLCTSFWVMPGLSIGVGGTGYLEGYSAISGSTAYPALAASGFSGYFGIQYSPVQTLRAGVSARLPARLDWGDELVADVVSQRTAFGLALLPMRGLTITAELDSRKNRACNLSAGAEYVVAFSEPAPWNQRTLLKAALRAGIKDGLSFGSAVTSTAAATAGGGIEYGRAGFRLALDYVVVYRSVFRDCHSIGLTVSY